MQSPVISITLATYNVEQYIADSLDCIINQTYKNIEIICIDDGSKDNTLQILQDYAKKDPRIVVVAKQKNEGLAVARNMSLELAKGKYVMFLDGDDLFDLQMIEKAVKVAEKEDADMVIWDYSVFYQEEEIKEKMNQSTIFDGINAKNKKQLLKLPAFTWIKLFKTQKLRELGVTFPKGLTRQDIPVYWQVITSIEKIALLPERLSYYRQQPQATTAQKDKRLLDLIQIMQITQNYLQEQQLYAIYQDVFLESQLNLLYGIYDNIDSAYKDETLSHIKKELKDDQWQYVFSSKPLRKQARWFYKHLKGSFISKIKLDLWLQIRQIYRKIK